MFELIKCVDKVVYGRNVSTKCLMAEMRRQSVSRGEKRSVLLRNASTKYLSGEMRRQSVFLEKCVDKAKFRLF